MLFERGLASFEQLFQVQVRGWFEFDLALLTPALDTSESVERCRVLPLEDHAVFASEAGDSRQAFQAHGLRGGSGESVTKTHVFKPFRHLRIGVVDLEFSARGAPVHRALRGQPVEHLLQGGGRRERVRGVLAPCVAGAVDLAGEAVGQARCPAFHPSAFLGRVHEGVEHQAGSLRGKNALALFVPCGRLPHARPAQCTRNTHVCQAQAVSGLHAIQ